MNHPVAQSASHDLDSVHCRNVSISADSAAELPAAHASGDAFDVSIVTMREGDSVAFEPDSQGEEVGAVISGQFSVDAAGERYQLSRGEGIIIPSGAQRTWTCDSPDGRLYRVVNRTSLENQNGTAP